MAAVRWRRLAAGLGMFALAFGFLLVLVVLLLSGPEVNTFAGGGFVLLFGNLAAVSTVAGLYVLDSSADQSSLGIRSLTLVGMGLVVVTANVMAGLVIGMGPEHSWPFFSPRTAALLIGLPVFLVGWFLLSRFGFPVWRKNNNGHGTDVQPDKGVKPSGGSGGF